MKFHTALDVSLRSVSICIVNDEGMIQFEVKIPSEVEEIDKYLRRFNPEITSPGWLLKQRLTNPAILSGREPSSRILD